MCLAVPARIVALAGDDATLDAGGVRVTGNVALIENPQVGDWVVLHTGVALTRLDADEAARLLAELRTLEDAEP